MLLGEPCTTVNTCFAAAESRGAARHGVTDSEFVLWTCGVVFAYGSAVFEGGDGTGIGGRVGEKGVGRGGWEGLYSSPVVNFGYNEL